MKRLTLLRHAKSSWKDLSQPDAVRPLNGRGKRDAPEMGLRFAQRYPDLDYVMITSPAQRAMSTARLFAEFARGLEQELDFEREGRVASEIAANLADDPRVVVGVE
jgi:phosphohistidine phosphatase SixA